MVTTSRVFLGGNEIDFSFVIYEEGIGLFIDTGVIYVADPQKNAFGTTYTDADCFKDVEVWNVDKTELYFTGRVSTLPGWANGYVVLPIEGYLAQYTDRVLTSFTTVQDKDSGQDRYTGYINTLSSTTLRDTSKNWATNVWIDYMCVVDHDGNIPEAERYLDIIWENSPVTVYVQNDVDDADFDDKTDSWALFNAIIRIDNTEPHRAYVRFPINIPPEATITSAILHVRAYTEISPSRSVRFRVIARDNCPFFPTGAGNESSYPVGTAYKDIDLSSYGAGDWIEVDLKDLLQEYVNRAGYVPGYFFGIRGEPLGAELSLLDFYSHDNGSDYPYLVITYTVTSSPAKIQFQISSNTDDTLTLTSLDVTGIMLGRPYYITKQTSKLAESMFTDYDYDQSMDTDMEDSSKAVIVDAPFGMTPLDVLRVCHDVDGFIIRVQHKIQQHHLGLYSFTDDEVGSNPTGWTVTEPSGTSVQVVSIVGGHYRVVEFYDNTAADYCWIKNTFTAQASGTIEFWLRVSANNKEFGIQMHESGAGKIWFYAAQGGTANCWKFYDGAWRYVVDSNLNNVGFAANTWYHIRIVFDCSSDSAKIYIDKTQVYWNNGGSPDEDFGFSSAATNIDAIMINTSSGLSGYYGYIDAVDYSWADGYYLNRNYDTESIKTFYALYKQKSSLSSAGSLPEQIIQCEFIPPVQLVINLVKIQDKYGTTYTRAWNYNTHSAQADSVTGLPSGWVQKEKALSTPRIADATICSEVADRFLEEHAEPDIAEDCTLTLKGDIDFQPGDLVDFTYDGDSYEDYIITRKRYDSHTDQTVLKLVKY